MRPYLPESWVEGEGRLDRAGVPEETRRRLSKGEIARELLDQVRSEGLPGRVVVIDSGHGAWDDFRGGSPSGA